MASSTHICDICDLRHIHKSAEVWCSECDEGLCVECQEHHGLSKATRKHRTLPITEYLSLPENILEIREYCDEHSEKFQLFCKQHNCPCCRVCVVASHKKCEDVETIERIVQNAKTSDTFKDTEQLIRDIFDTIEKMRKNRQDHLTSVQQRRQDIEKEISALRTKIRQHLDQIQEKLMKELAEVETKVQDKTTDVLNSLSKEEKQLNDYQSIMSSIKQHATDLQTFLSIHGIEREVANIDKSIHTLLKSEAMNNTTFSCQFTDMIKIFPTKIKVLGKVIVQSCPCDVTISRRKDTEAQIMVVLSPSKSIENITLKLKQTINTKEKDTHGCLLLPNDRMIFSCYKMDIVKSINEDGTQDFDTGELPIKTFDITYIEDTSTIAVTSGGFFELQCIRIIDMRSGQIKRTISVKSSCYGIVYRNNTLIYCAEYEGLRMINLNDGSECNVLIEQMSSMSYVATYRDKLYYTNCDTHTVTCCDLHGNTQWQFKDESLLRFPLGISIDNEGNVYVVGLWSFNVVVISSEGQHGRQLLGEENGLINPQVLHYDRSTNQLLVANQSDVVFLFQVTRS